VKPGLVAHAERDFARVFGIFNDSLPDGWGLLLMDREFKKRGFSPATLLILDRLAYIGTRGMGALTYHPPMEAGAEEALWIDLDALARQAERILEGSAEDLLPALRIAGGSPGGARVVEAAYVRMAAKAGVEVPETRLFETGDGGRYFAAERFDRAGNLRLHMTR
jgi:serine/threonine-protein kinase HipA